MEGQPDPNAIVEGGFLLLDPVDNIMIAVQSLRCGAWVRLEDRVVQLTADIELGHKVARHDLAAGDKVRRYGFPIGTMRVAARMGDHVHQHNLASDYLPAHGRDAAQKEREA